MNRNDEDDTCGFSPKRRNCSCVGVSAAFSDNESVSSSSSSSSFGAAPNPEREREREMKEGDCRSAGGPLLLHRDKAYVGIA